MRIEPEWLIVAAVISGLVGVVLHRWQRPPLAKRYVWITVFGTLFALYYILNVLFGSGRTGWP
ncbi:hypothetical protein [Desulfovibrio sp. Fe33]|uniref:hypothetical protein n=1 Tax=Desulfovibrio sp. Fe33 TaxID=3020842 RepID=UPI00234DBA88|nr:hypothetical protein [Desulfovibrio sp. Fe33]